MRLTSDQLFGIGAEQASARRLAVPARSAASEAGSLTESFGELVRQKVAETEASIQEADQASGDLVVGKTGDIHGTMLALERADLEFRLLSAVRNKAVEAYREVMRMGI